MMCFYSRENNKREGPFLLKEQEEIKEKERTQPLTPQKKNLGLGVILCLTPNP